MNPIPNAEKLMSLRKGLRKRKLPQVADGLSCNCPHTGKFEFFVDGDDFRAEWAIVINGVLSESRSAYFFALCREPELEQLRLELGWMIAEAFERTACYMQEAIPAPDESMREYSRYHKQAESWRHWAIVPAGFMSNL